MFRSLSSAEKESLALVDTMKEFHQYICGLRFTIITDHKPFLEILGENKSIPKMAAPRYQR